MDGAVNKTQLVKDLRGLSVQAICGERNPACGVREEAIGPLAVLEHQGQSQTKKRQGLFLRQPIQSAGNTHRIHCTPGLGQFVRNRRKLPMTVP